MKQVLTYRMHCCALVTEKEPNRGNSVNSSVQTGGREKTTAKSKEQGERATELPRTDSTEGKLLSNLIRAEGRESKTSCQVSPFPQPTDPRSSPQESSIALQHWGRGPALQAGSTPCLQQHRSAARAMPHASTQPSSTESSKGTSSPKNTAGRVGAQPWNTNQKPSVYMEFSQIYGVLPDLPSLSCFERVLQWRYHHGCPLANGPGNLSSAVFFWRFPLWQLS